MNTIELIDRVKTAYGLTSDYQLAKKLAVSHSRISNYRNGKRTADDDLVLKCETLLDMPPGSLLVEFQAQRTKCKEAAAILHRLSEKLMSTAAAILLAVSMAYGVALDSGQAQAAPVEVGNTVYYVKSLPVLLALFTLGYICKLIWLIAKTRKTARFRQLSQMTKALYFNRCTI